MTENPSIALIPSGYKSGTVYSQIPNDGDGDFTFVRASSATRIDSDGLIEEVATGVPRLDYTDSSCPVLLLEPQVTNLALRSEEINNGVWSKSNATVTTNSASAPDGTTSADTLTATGASGQIQQLVTGSASTTYTVSFWIKRKTGSGQVNIRSVENINTPITITTNWERYDVTTTSTGTTIRVGVNLAVSGDEVYIWGGQLEQLEYATSYIKTEGSTVTRLKDECNSSGTSAEFNDSEGVLYCEISALTDGSTSRQITISNTTANRITVFFAPTTNRIAAQVYVGGVVQAHFFTDALNRENFNKIAFKWKANDFALWINGTEIGADTSGSVPTGLDELSFDDGGGANDFYGKCKDLRVYTTALTDAELTELTT